MNRKFNKVAALLATAVVATSLFGAAASAGVSNGQTIAIPIPTTPGGEVTFLGQKIFLPRNMTGQAVLTYQTNGQAPALTVGESVAADDCTFPQDPFIGVDAAGGSGSLSASLHLSGTAVGADGTTQQYDRSVADSRQLGSSENVEVLSICLDL